MVVVQTTLDGARLEIEKVQVNLKDLEHQLLRTQTVFLQYVYLLRRTGLPENADQAITKLTQVIRIMMQARMALLAFQAARMAAGDPLAWLTFGATAAGFAFDAGDLWQDLG